MYVPHPRQPSGSWRDPRVRQFNPHFASTPNISQWSSNFAAPPHNQALNPHNYHQSPPFVISRPPSAPSESSVAPQMPTFAYVLGGTQTDRPRNYPPLLMPEERSDKMPRIGEGHAQSRSPSALLSGLMHNEVMYRCAARVRACMHAWCLHPGWLVDRPNGI